MADPLVVTWKGMTFLVYNTEVDVEFGLDENGTAFDVDELDDFIELLQTFRSRMKGTNHE